MLTISSVVGGSEIANHPSADTAIEAEQLVRHDGEMVAVAGVTFAVGRGEIFGYLGRNGSGKTTTVRMLTTLTRPTAGTARVAGVDIADARRVREHTGPIDWGDIGLGLSLLAALAAVTYGLAGRHYATATSAD